MIDNTAFHIRPAGPLYVDHKQHINADGLVVTGAGVKVLVIDTGYDLESSNTNVVNTFSVDESAQDLAGHGTMVTNVLTDLAPDVSVYVAKASLGDATSFTVDNLIAALDWAVTQDVDIVNMSLSAAGNVGPQIIHDAVERVTSAGVEVVASVGNSFPVRIGFPAHLDDVHGVGASTETDQRAEFSQIGRKLDIYAPGTDILLTGLNGAKFIGNGTSFSAPIVTGTMALMLEVGKDPDSIYDYVLPVKDEEEGVINVGFALNVADDSLLHHWHNDNLLSVSYLVPEQSVAYDVAVYITHGDVCFELTSGGGFVLADDELREISFHGLASETELVGNLYGWSGVYSHIDTTVVSPGSYTFHAELYDSVTGYLSRISLVVI